MEPKRITILAGHYGSGKTNVAVNYAVWQKNQGYNVKIFDMDIVNPYFRTLDGKDILDRYNIPLVASSFANSNVDTPAMNPQSYAMIHDKEKNAVVDVGGDDRGALALGRFEKDILKENNYDMLLVVNKYRFETKTIEGLIEIMTEIEQACGIKFNGIVNDSNLGRETTKETILNSIKFVNEFSKVTGLDVKFTCAREDLYDELKDEIKNLIPIEVIHYGDWC